jgi:Ca2+-transporting ATPase
MESGLTSAEAARRLAADGPNQLPRPPREGLVRTLLDVIREPMIALLLVCSAIYFGIGDPGEAALLLVGVLGVIVLTLVQKRRASRALDALRDLSEPHSTVLRDGHAAQVPRSSVVRGDVALLAEGDRAPADGVLLDGPPLQVDESLLTGESVAVRKRPVTDDDAPTGPPGGDDTPHVFAGTLVTAGSGTVRVTETGAATAMGRIGSDLAAIAPGDSALQRETRRLVTIVGIGAAVLSVAIAVAYGLLRGAWIDGVLAGLATAIGLLPEEFPVVLVVFLAIGAFRMARAGVLTRRMPAIEALGATTVLCTDKTGTLTENRMRVRALWTPGAEVTLDGVPSALAEALHPVVEHAILASAVAPSDPMEVALRELGDAALAETEHLHPDWALRREYALSADLFAMTRAWDDADGRLVREVSAKGAPEAILDLCHADPAVCATWGAASEALAARGLRVLGVARARVAGLPLPDDQHDFAFEPVGLVAFEDPLRTGIPDAIRQCHDAGVRVVMITGDYPSTAAAIAAQAGLPVGRPVTGEELAALDDEGLRARLHGAAVAARIVPSDKLRIVRALQADGEIVAMTGDGVNDAPALAAAQIGVAMGRRGTDVARESAALVLVEDDFASLVGAMARGRLIFENLRKSMSYILAVHTPIAGLAALPVFFGWPPLLLPIHIVLLELVIDPACSLAFEAEPADDDLMRRPPRRASAPLVNLGVVARAVASGLPVLLASLGVYAWALDAFPGDGGEARSLAFATLMAGNVGLILANRAPRGSGIARLAVRNRVVPWVVGGALGVTGLLLVVPGLGSWLHFDPVPLWALGVPVGAGLVAFLAIEAIKLVVGLLTRRGAS